MKRLSVGVLAHVDAGKTTLSEGLLYRCGGIRRLGRVDHGDAFLDTFQLERERGITIFSKQAVLCLEDAQLTLLDTPGHVDFSGEMERTLQVLDYAVLVISGTDGVQGHTTTLWRLLARYGIPTFLFINKMDLAGSDRSRLLPELKKRLSDACVDFNQDRAALMENAALCDETALEHYLEAETLTDEMLTGLIARRRLFPCFFGSALKLDGVDSLLRSLSRYTRQPDYTDTFGAKVFKISRDAQGSRLTHMKITGGSLRVRSLLTNRRAGLAPEQVWAEKADQLRIYSGEKYRTAEEVCAGTVCAVTGLSQTYPGQGLGGEPTSQPPALEPVLTYRLLLPQDCDPFTVLPKLRQLEEEDPLLHIVWREALHEIHLQLMGEVQLEVLERQILDRFGLAVSFGPGAIVYRETIAAPVEGIGHFEPLRHYAEVHLLLEPGEPGSGLQFASDCPEDQLDRNWQRLILTHLEERTHPGVLTGSPITDMKLTLIAGRAHIKHTEGGDFRQATYRALRQGLMGAQSILLEPWYDFRLELPTETVGRALSDFQRMWAQIEPPQPQGEETLLTGSVPVSALGDYAGELSAYTRGRGRLLCTMKGYAPCHNQEEVVESLGYDPLRDQENSPDSVFCSHGAGYVVPWDQVPEQAHVESGLFPGRTEEDPRPSPLPSSRSYSTSLDQDKELQAIFERTYGPVKRREFIPRPAVSSAPQGTGQPTKQIQGPEYLLVDGYNIIFAWDQLKSVARDNLDAARRLLMDLLSNYQGFKKCEVILVFDAYKVPHGTGEVSTYHNIHVVYTKEAETADAYIEKVTYQLGKQHRVRVATSDGIEQLIIMGHGALRLSARAFLAEVEAVSGQISAALAENNRRARPRTIASELAAKDVRSARGNPVTRPEQSRA